MGRVPKRHGEQHRLVIEDYGLDLNLVLEANAAATQRACTIRVTLTPDSVTD